MSEGIAPMTSSPRRSGTSDSTDSKVFRRRREILDTAAQIFYEKGYDATSTKDIADAAGLLKGSLYYYIETKEDFLFEIIKESHDGALATLDRVRQVEGDTLARLARLVSEHFRYFVENLVTTTIYFREFRVLSPERQALIAAEGDLYLEFVRELLTQGQQEGVIAEELDVRLISIGIVGMVNSAWLWYQPGGSRSIDEIAAEFVKVIVAGVASDHAIDAAGSAAALRESISHVGATSDNGGPRPAVVRPARAVKKSTAKRGGRS
jgi:AcrR family transcriptional regulator